MGAAADGSISQPELDALFEEAVRSTIAELEATGSPIVTDGEQRKPSFATYPIHGLDTLAGNGVVIPFADGHTRQLPVLTAGRSGTRRTPTPIFWRLSVLPGAPSSRR